MSRQEHASRTWITSARTLVLATSLAFGAGCSADPSEPETTATPLTAMCLASDSVLIDGGWRCGDARIAECNGYFGTAVDYIYVTVDMFPNDGEALTCAEVDLSVSDEGPFLVGDTTIVVHQQLSDADFAVCTSRLTVVDTTPPVVTTHDFELWPPNHKLHTVVPDDCLEVRDACDADVAVWFTGASSDEPADDIGDGNHEPDIIDGVDAVQLRAERSGTGNGRVYTLAWRAEDFWGNQVDGVCHVIVPHDQGDKLSIQDGDAYHLVIAQP